MKKHLLIPLVPVFAMLAFAAPALAATPEAASENWAGYEATPSSGTTSTTSSGSEFSAVSGGWTQPSVSCTSGAQTYSAYWVGLGGGSQGSEALEQIGTQADCNGTSSTSTQYAWYELVPAAPVKIKMTIHTGDKIWARTAVSGDKVTLFLSDQTTGQKFSKTLTMSNPDTSTAEWVAEAPSECQGGASGECTPLPLSDFGKVKFTDANATSGGHTGSISSWNSEAIALEPSSSSMFGGGFGGGFGQGGFGEGAGYSGGFGSDTSSDSSGGASPGSLSSNGSSFTVTYGSDATAQDTSSGFGNSAGSGTGTGSGYGGSSGYGYGGASGYGYGGASGYGYGGASGYGYGGAYGGAGGYSGADGYGDAGGYGYGSGGFDGGYSDGYANSGSYSSLL
jgi:Peptidase A4 family